jgi:hypothetical protein
MNTDKITTVLGVGTAVGVAVHPLLTTGKISWVNVAVAAVVAAFGYFTNKKSTSQSPASTVGDGAKPVQASSAARPLAFKALASFAAMALLVTTCTSTTGCSAAKFDSTVSVIEKQIPAAEALAQDVATLASDPSIGTFAIEIGTAASVDLPALTNAISAYKANKTASTKAAIFAVLTSFQSSVNAQLLAANRVVDAGSQKSALAKLAAFALVVNGLELALAPFFNGPAAVSAKAEFQQVQPFIPRDAQEQIAEVYGYKLGDFGL